MRTVHTSVLAIVRNCGTEQNSLVNLYLILTAQLFISSIDIVY